MMRSILEFDDSNYYGKKVLMRVDFNVSIDDGVIGEDYRIRMAIPTIEYLTKRGAYFQSIKSDSPMNVLGV